MRLSVIDNRKMKTFLSAALFVQVVNCVMLLKITKISPESRSLELVQVNVQNII